MIIESDPKLHKTTHSQTFSIPAGSHLAAADLDVRCLSLRLRYWYSCCHKCRCQLDQQSACKSGCQSVFRFVYRILQLFCLWSRDAVSCDILSWLYIHSRRLIPEGLSLGKRIYCLYPQQSSAWFGTGMHRSVFTGNFPSSCDADSRTALYVLVCPPTSTSRRRACGAGSGRASRAWMRIGAAVDCFGREGLCSSLCTESALIRS